MQVHRWEDIENEALAEGVWRRVVHSERMTIARLSLSKGAVVGRHSHENEQVSYVVEGSLRFIFDDKECIVSSGEMMQIASHEPHRVEALEDSLAVDLFQPVREDWIRGDDAYLRNPADT